MSEEYRDITIKGTGITLRFPKSMSDDDIAAAIQTHPDYKNIKVEKSAQPSWVEKLPLIGDKAKQGREAYPKFLEDNPVVASQLDRIRGTDKLAFDLVGSMMTQAATGPKLLASMVGQAGFGGAARTQDKIAEKGLDLNEADAKDIGISSGVSSLGPLAGRVLSPHLPLNPEIIKKHKDVIAIGDRFEAAGRPIPENLKNVIDSAKRSLAVYETKTPKPWAEKAGEVIEKSLVPAAAGTVLGHAMGNPLIGGLAGALFPHTGKMVKSYPTNEIMHHPSTQAILNAMFRGAGNQIETPQ